VLNGLFFITRWVSCGRIVTADEDEKEYWTYKLEGPKPWFIRVARNPKKMLAPTPDDRLPRRSLSSSMGESNDKADIHDTTVLADGTPPNLNK